MLDAAVRRVPITGGVERVSAPEGSTIAEFVAIAFPLESHRCFVVASIDGEEIAPEAWDRAPRAGETVQLAFRPGGKDFFRTLLQIAVIAVAAWVGFGGLGGWFAAGTWQAAVAAAGVSILGNLAINALIPLPKPGTIEAPPPYYSLSNARNSARPWGAVPMLFGTHRIVPPRMSEPFQEVVGGVTYLRFALCLGLCPMQVSDWKIGETALSSYSGVEIEVRLNESDPPHTLITGDPTQESVGATLNHTEWTVRTTATDVDEIEVIYDFASGLGGLDSKGRKTSRTVNLRLQYRPTGSSEDWTDWRPTVPQANTASNGAGVPYRPQYFEFEDDLVAWRGQLGGMGGVAGDIVPITRADPGRAFRHSERFAVPRGQYDVRTQRAEAASTDPNIVDSVSWGILGSIRSQADPFPNRKLATACFRIKATEQLSNMVDTVNCIASSLQPVFSAEALADPTIASASEFTDVETSSNPAVLALLAARGPNTAYPKPDAEIDWPAFASAAAKATARGLTFNEYVETSIGRWEMVRRILAAMHARPVKHMGKLSVVVDDSKAGQPPAQVFTPRNVRNFRWQKTYPRLPHAIRTPFANAANNWAADEVTVYMPGQSAETATRYETVAMPGKTNADEIRTVVNQYARNGHYQTESFEFETDAEHLTVKRGDYCVVQHFAMATGLGAARIRTREVNGGGDVTAIVLDRPVETPEATSLAVQWRTIVADSGLARMEVLGEQAVTRDAANPKRFVFTTPQSGATKPAAAGEDYEGDIALVGIAGKVSFEVLVRDIAPRPHLQAAISCIAYAGERFVDAPDWPAHDPKVSLPYMPRPPAPVQLGSPTASAVEIAVAFSQPAMPRGLELRGYVVARREHGASADTWEPLGQLRADERVAIAPAGEPGAKYDIRIVGFGRREDGATVYSDPLIVAEISAATAPAEPAGCGGAFTTRTSSGGAQQLVLTATWTANENPDVLDTVVEQRVSTGPDVWQEIGRGAAAAGRTEIHGLPVGRAYLLRFINISKRGAPSTPTTIDSITAPDTLVATGALAAVPGSALANDIAAAATSSDAAAAAAAASAAAAAAEADAAAASALTASGAATAASGSASAAAGSATSASNSASSAAGSATAAASSATAAAASASGAAGSASAASTSASAASTSASNAATSASAASTSATNAATSAGSAGTSATNAAASATDAAGHASSASSSASAAAASQSAAAGSASAASTSASTASTQATNAATSASAAATSATNAATQASNASTSASSASTSAGNAATSATTAATQASNAAGSASSAASSASSASSSASAASNSATLSATFAAGSQGSINSSATFADNANATGVPTNWESWDGGTMTRVTGIAPQPYAIKIDAGAGANGGIAQTLNGRVAPGWHVLEADVTLLSGAFTGSGIYMHWGPGSGFVHSAQTPFVSTPDITGSAPGAGTTDKLYKFRKLVNIVADSDLFQMFVMSHWDGFGSVASANSIKWHRAALRPASQAEIEARQATLDLVTANANIATNAAAAATNAASIASLNTTVSANHTALITPSVNLVPYPSGTARGSVAEGISTTAQGWVVGGGSAGAGFVNGYWDPVGGPILYNAWGSGYSSGVARYYYLDIPVSSSGGGYYTFSFSGYASNIPYGDINYRLQALNGAGSWVGESATTTFAAAGPSHLNRTGVVFLTPSGTEKIRILFRIEPTTSAAASYADFVLRALQLEAGQIATKFNEAGRIEANEARVGTAEADIITNAAASATNAASIASLSTTVSANYTSLTTGAEVIPSTFDKNDTHWTNVGMTFADVPGYGRVAVANAIGDSIRSKAKMLVKAGHTYRASVKYRVETDSTSGDNPKPLFGVVGLDSTGTYAGAYWTVGFVDKTVADGWQTSSVEFSAATILASGSGVALMDIYGQPNWHGTGAPNAVIQILYMKLEDVTDAAANAAAITTANANIASNASAIATESTARAAAVEEVRAYLTNKGDCIHDEFRDSTFWNLPLSGVSLIDTDGGWRWRRAIQLSNGTYDHYSDFFPVEPGATYRIRCRIWNNAGSWSGYFHPLIHMPNHTWYSLKHGGGVDPSTHDATNGIVAAGDTGNLEWIVTNPTGILDNANRQWQFRFYGSFTGGPVVVACEIVRLDQYAIVNTLKEAFVDDTTGLAIARLVLEASASGGRPARFSLYSDSEGTANAALDAARIFFGDNTIWEDEYNTFYTEAGGERLRFGGPFGSSGNLFMWRGSAIVALNSETKANAKFAIATDEDLPIVDGSTITTPTVDDQTKTGTANFDNIITSGTTATTMATIDLTVGASGYLELLSPLFYGPLSINQESGMTLSAGTDWFGQMIVTEQLQSGGTEHTLWTIPLQISDTGGGLFDFIFDPPVVKVVAQNVSGASRYRLKLQRTSGSNNVSGNGLQGKFTIRRTP